MFAMDSIILEVGDKLAWYPVKLQSLAWNIVLFTYLRKEEEEVAAHCSYYQPEHMSVTSDYTDT